MNCSLIVFMFSRLFDHYVLFMHTNLFEFIDGLINKRRIIPKLSREKSAKNMYFIEEKESGLQIN